ncbi:MAG: LPXTG cell wall anchor domain-containing protein [Phycisphaerales bacterium]
MMKTMLGDRAAQLPDMGMTQTIGLAIGVCVVIAGIIMLIGSINLLRRKRSGVKLLRIWVVLRLILAIVGLAFAWLTFDAQVSLAQAMLDMQNQQIIEAGGEARQMSREALQWQTSIQTIFYTGLVVVYPVVLGWLLTGRRVRDDIATWE